MGPRGAFSTVGILWAIIYLCVLKVVPNNTAQLDDASICNIKGCNCTSKTVWRIVNCTFTNTQDVTLNHFSIDQKITEIFISGGHELTLRERSFSQVPGLSIVYISGSQQVVIEKEAFYKSSSISLRIEIENCDRLIFRNEAFKNSNSTLSVEVSRIGHCSIERAAYSKLLNATFSNIGRLDLLEGAFEFNKLEGGTSGAGLITIVVLFKDVTISKIPREAFFSSLAEICFQNCRIEEIQTEAFFANQITTMHFLNSSIDYFRSDAFHQRTLVMNFEISDCSIVHLETKALMRATSNLTLQRTIIRNIETGAMNLTVARVDIVKNQIANLHPSGFVFTSWNRIAFNNNSIRTLGANAISGRPAEDLQSEFYFFGNDIFNSEDSSLNFMSDLESAPTRTRVENNFFNITCHCSMEEWLHQLVNDSKSVLKLLHSNFCHVDDLLSRCFDIKVGTMNMKNFTELVCDKSDKIKCEHYNGEEKLVNTTIPILRDDPPNKSWLVLILTCVGLLIIAVIATFVFVLMSGRRWLKKKRLFRNIHFNQNEQSNDDENTIVTMDDSDNKLEVPEELTLEYLEYLKKRLDDPDTQQETSDMIEKLYEMFIVDDSYENNNRQDEEAHLYEELANIQQPKEKDQLDLNGASQNTPRSILRIMEEKFNLQFNDNDDEEKKNRRPQVVVNEYSEPSDAAVHLYSELKQAQNNVDVKKDSLKSFGSGKNMFRPLPNKPTEDHSQPGPSSLN